MTRNTTLTGALILALGVTALPAMAQDSGDGPRGPRGPMFQFEEIDANSDGKLTREEIEAHAAARFADADTDGDGQLSAAELVARMEKQSDERIQRRVEGMIEHRDANDDGMLSADEMGPRNKDRMFSRLDANDDGEISKAEMEQAREKMHKRFGEHRKGERGHGDWKKPRHGDN